MNDMNKISARGDLLLEVKNLSIGFGNPVVEVVDKVNFKIHAGEVFSLVGESGCGKSVSAASLLRLLPTPSASVLSGEILWKSEDVLKFSQQELSELRGYEISMIFQDPGAALNPVIKLGDQLRECFTYNRIIGESKSFTNGKVGAKNKDVKLDKKSRLDNVEERIDKMLLRVGFGQPERIKEAYAHELSGGMLQRVMIAMALLPEPEMIIADEPTTALDVTVQAQIMELLVNLAHEYNVAILLITHNLNLVAQYADRVAVMYAGRIVEDGVVETLLKNPLHPYTQGLLNALPKMDGSVDDLNPIDGQVPQPTDFVEGCRFKKRCILAKNLDSNSSLKCDLKPLSLNVSTSKDRHNVACFYVEENSGR